MSGGQWGQTTHGFAELSKVRLFFKLSLIAYEIMLYNFISDQ